MPSDPVYVGAVEGGGTSFKLSICQVVNQDTTPVIVQRVEIDSSGLPEATLQASADFFRQHLPTYPLQALAIATFGPVGLDPSKPETYGRILRTSPKAAWRNVDLLTPLREACQLLPHQVAVETDVNAPAWAEYRRYRQKQSNKSEQNDNQPSISSCAYITVGTGVGVGLVVNHQTVHGRMHPEGGHIAVPPLHDNDPFQGYSWGATCPYHGKHTVEGMASSVALLERYLQRMGADPSAASRQVLSTLDDEDELWQHAAAALASLCVNLILTLSVERIVLGGGVMNRPGLLEKIHALVVKYTNGYVDLPRPLGEWIVRSEAGADAGLVGAMELAQSKLKTTNRRDQSLKQEAFGLGLWYGAMVGAVLTAVACKVLLIQPLQRRR